MYINNDIDYLKYLINREVVIFGAGKQGIKVFSILKRKGIKIIAFCDNNPQKQGKNIEGTIVISIDKLHEINNNNIMIIICSTCEREIREQLLLKNIYNYISVSQIDFGGAEEYYDEEYFMWQQEIGIFGGKINAPMFQSYIEKNSVVVELGCGGGYLLNNIVAKEKIGIEINDFARSEARENGIKAVKYTSEIPDNYADVIISTHVLEHVENPFGILKELHKKLKENGKIIFRVPNESCDIEYQKSEINNHLYTWNCLTIGNLFKAAGYFVYSVKKIEEMWPNNYIEIEKEVSPELFQVIMNIVGKVFSETDCIIVAYR